MTNTATLYYDLISQSSAAVMVFRDGVRAVLDTDYTVDYFARAVTVNLTVNGSPVQQVMLHPFGFGGNSPVSKQYLSYGIDALTLPEPTAAENLAVSVNGSLLSNTDYTFDGSTVTLTAPPSLGSDVVLLVYDANSASATTMQMQTWTYSSGSTFALTYPDTETFPPHAGTIVEVNGLRLTPPTTFYGSFDTAHAWMYLPLMPTPAQLTVYYRSSAAPGIAHANGQAGAVASSAARINAALARGIGRSGGAAVSAGVATHANAHNIGVGHASGSAGVSAASQNWVRYTTAVPTCNAVRNDSTYPFHIMLPSMFTMPAVAGQFVLFDNMLVALDARFVSAEVVVVLTDQPADYTVSNNHLTISKTLTPGDRIDVTTFSNAGCMGIRTVTYWDTGGQYIIPQPYAPDYALVTMQGKAIALDGDYAIYSVPASNSNISFMATVVATTETATAPLVATVFTGAAARDRTSFMLSTTTPAAERMVPLSDVYGFDKPPLDTDNFDDVQNVPDGFDGTRLDALPYDVAFPHAPFDSRAKYSIANSYEYLRLSPYMAGRLVNDLAMDAASIEISLFLHPLAAKLQDAEPLPLPTATVPGVIWVDDERIEYFGYSRAADVVTVTALRRATRGTSTGAKRLVQTGSGTGSPQTFYFSALGTVDVTFDGVIQPPSVYSGTEIYSGTHVNFTAPAGAYIVIGLSMTVSHLAGAAVWNGQQVLATDPSLPVALVPVSDFGIAAANSGNIVAHDGVGIGHAAGSNTIYAYSDFTAGNSAGIATAAGDALTYAVGVIGYRSLFGGSGHGSAAAYSGALGIGSGGGMAFAIGAAADWSALDLGGSQALGCSDDGSVVVGTAASFAVQFSGGTITTLPSFDGTTGYDFVARGCSADGSIVVGSSPDAISGFHAMRWSGGTFTDLGRLPGATGVYAAARGCSADGAIIVGGSSNTIGHLQAVYWQGGTITALDIDAYENAEAVDCSDDGSIITGYALIGSNTYAVYWVKATGVLTTLGALGSGTPGGCSGDGTIVAATSDTDGAVYYTLATGVPTTLGLLTGGTFAYANACSEDGHYIVGGGDATDGLVHPILWTAGVPSMLPALTGFTGSFPGEATWISRDGAVIVGNGNDTSGAQVAIRWTA